jgi:phage portal protein BeeE
MLSPDDLSVGGLMGQTVSRICAAIGVDPMCLGLPSESKTYSNYEQALEALVRQVVIPLQETVARQLTDQLVRRILRDDRTELVWDRSDVYVLQDDEAAKRDSAARLYQSGVATLNEARALIGLPPVRGGDVPAGGRLAGLGGGL